MAYMRLYRYSGEPNRRIKSDYLSNYDGTKLGITGDEINGTIKAPYNVVYPTIIFESDKGFPWNYLQFISDYEYDVAARFYFITKVTYLNNNLYEVECVEDVITTFGDVIYNYGYGLVDRNENLFNNYIPDAYRTLELGETVSDLEIDNDIFIKENSSSVYGIWFLSGLGLNESVGES